MSKRCKRIYPIKDFTKDFYRVNEVAKLLGVTTTTIRNYEKEGLLNMERTEGNHRILSKTNLLAFLKERGLIEEDETSQGKVDIIYVLDLDVESCRKVSLNIVSKLESLKNPVFIYDILYDAIVGYNSLNSDMTGIKSLISMVADDKVRNIYVRNKEELAKDEGYAYLKLLFDYREINIIEVD